MIWSKFLQVPTEEQQEATIISLYCTTRDKEQADELIVAGWRFFPQSENSGIAQWYWRSPKTKRGNGTLYRSTNQAHRAMKKKGRK